MMITLQQILKALNLDPSASEESMNKKLFMAKRLDISFHSISKLNHMSLMRFKGLVVNLRTRSMWTAENRGSYDRSKLRYPSDVTDDEWNHIAPLIPPAERGGRRRSVDVREVVNGLMYILSTGCQWRSIPKDLPPT